MSDPKKTNPFRLLTLLLFSLLTVLIVTVAGWLRHRNKQDCFKNLANTAAMLHRYYEITFHQRELNLMSIGNRLLDFEGDSSAQQRHVFAKRSLKDYYDLITFGLADTTGQLITFTGAENLTDPLPNLVASEKSRRSFLEVKKAQGIVIGEVYFFEPLSRWIIPIRVALRDQDGQLLAINTSAISYEALIQELASFKLHPQYKVHVVNATFNTTQLYYPLAENQYTSWLGQAADLYPKKEIVEYIKNEKVKYALFESEHRLEGYKVLGVSTEYSGLKHYITISVNASVLSSMFWEDFMPIFILYVFLAVFMCIGIFYFEKANSRFTQNLQTQRDYSHNIIQQSPILILRINAENECTFLNPKAEEITGYTLEDFKGKNFWKVLYPKSYYQQVEHLFEARKAGNATPIALKLLSKSGIEKTVSWNSTEIPSEHEVRPERIAFGVDVTEQRKAQMALSESEANLKAIFENTNHIIGLFDTELKLIEFNQAFADYALQTDNIVLAKGKSILAQLSKERATVFKKYLNITLKGEKHTQVMEYPLTNGGRIYFMLSYNPIKHGEEVIGVSLFAQDITELKLAQKSLENYSTTLENLVEERTLKLHEANQELQAINEALYDKSTKLQNTLDDLKKTQSQLVQAEKMASLGVLAAGVGHEINNPLNFIKGGITGLKNELMKKEGQLDEKAEPFFKIIQEGISRTSAIVKSLSHFSRQSDESSETCYIHDIIDNCTVMLHNKLKHKVTVRKEYTPQAIVLKGNNGKLHQVFLNLLTNAEQAIGKKGNITIKTQIGETNAHITISDDGSGISPKNLSKISDPFFTTKPPGVGTGLGLSITYKIVQEHGGTIEVRSEVDEGTDFIVTLPLRKKVD